MTAKVITSSLAERDILEALLYVGHETRSPAGAERLAQAIDEACALYAENPRLGTSRPDLGENFRIFSCGTKSNPHGWTVVYRPLSNGIEVLRMLRASQDYNRLFQ